MNKSERKTFIADAVIIAILLLMMALPGLFINKEKDKVSERENRVLANYPESWTDMSDFKQQFDSWLNDNIGFRDQLLTIRTGIMFNTLGIVTGNSVHRGTEGWYYYTKDENLQIATGEYTMNDEILEKILNNHLKIRDKLAEKGIEYVIVMPASKVSIYPEYLGFGDGEVKETVVDTVANYINDNSNLKVIRLKEALVNEKSNHQVYFKHDTHWNQRGAYCAYRKIITDLNDWGLLKTAPFNIDFIESEYLGEFGGMLGDSTLLGMEPTEIMDTSGFAAERPMDEKYYAMQNLLSRHGFRYPWYYYKNASMSEEPSAMFYGDSMFGSWNITEALAENFSEFTYIWSYEIFEDVIDAASPDIVFYEITERFLNRFPDKNVEFLSEKLSTYSADILDFETKGDDITVTVLNDSGSAWRKEDAIRCCLWMNNEDWGIRAYIPDGTEVAPGETVTLTFENVSASVEIADTVEIQMLQEGVLYFGDRIKVKPR